VPDKRPLIGLTVGDPAGIGPELVLKVMGEANAVKRCRTVVIGDPEVIRAAATALGVAPVLCPVANMEALPESPDVIPVLCPAESRIGIPEWGKIDPAYGKHAALCLAEALDQRHGFDALVCAPMNKEAFHLAGYDYADELGYMSELTGSRNTAFMGVMSGVWTYTVSEHVPFSEIRSYVRRERILDRILSLHKMLVRAGYERPRVAVAALNPHAGEGGLFGTDEIDEIAPAIDEARKLGVDAEGPVPGDMVFVLATEGRYPGVVAMYHDQANIARKLYARGRGCTVYYGLPVPATTTAHGTAFDIAGKGKANPDSLRDALQTALALAGYGSPTQ
jgi:4-hydroxythreonine-4-phosphate dehydrogenase